MLNFVLLGPFYVFSRLSPPPGATAPAQRALLGRGRYLRSSHSLGTAVLSDLPPPGGRADLLNFVLLRPILQIFVHVLPMESPPPPRGNSLAGMGVAALLPLSNLIGSPIWEHGD